MPRQYPTGFRDEMVRRMLAGESVSDLVFESRVPMQTLHRWKHQALIDAGLVKGTDSTKSAALRAAHKRIKSLEKELQLVKDASEIYDSLEVMDPKEGRPSR
jgi:transposase-like protein